MTRKLECKAAARLLKEAFLAKNVRLSHTEALDLVARLEGFEAWSHMAAAKRASAAPAAAAPKTLSAQDVLVKKYGCWYSAPSYPRADWSYAATNNDTSRGYFDWLVFEMLTNEVQEVESTSFVAEQPWVHCLTAEGHNFGWPIETDLTDCEGNINSSQLETKPSLLDLLVDASVHERLRNLLVGEDTYVAAWAGDLGLLFEAEYYSRESDDPDSSRGYNPYDVVVEKLRLRLATLKEEFPEATFGIPPAERVYHGRPAIWAFVSENVAARMGEERRKALAYRMGSM